MHLSPRSRVPTLRQARLVRIVAGYQLDLNLEEVEQRLAELQVRKRLERTAVSSCSKPLLNNIQPDCWQDCCSGRVLCLILPL